MQDSALFDDVAKQALGRYEFDGDEAKLFPFRRTTPVLCAIPSPGRRTPCCASVARATTRARSLRARWRGCGRSTTTRPSWWPIPCLRETAATSKASSDPMGQPISTLNTHTRYLHEGIVNYAEHLVALLPPEVDRVMFECSGSEANDLAVRVARTATGGTGVIVTSEAYHGNTALITGLSPSIGTDQPMLPDMRMIPTPDTWRLGTNDIGAWMAARVAEQIADMRRHGFKFAALLVDSRASISSKTPWKRAFCSKNALIDAAKRHPCLGDVRGAGFFIGVDVVKPGTKEPDYEHAVDSIEAMREHHVLTSLCGPAGNILKIRPPLVFSPNDVDRRATRRWPQEDAQASVCVHPCHRRHLHVFTCGEDGEGGGSARQMRPLPGHGGRLPRAARALAPLRRYRGSRCCLMRLIQPQPRAPNGDKRGHGSRKPAGPVTPARASFEKETDHALRNDSRTHHLHPTVRPVCLGRIQGVLSGRIHKRQQDLREYREPKQAMHPMGHSDLYLICRLHRFGSCVPRPALGVGPEGALGKRVPRR